MTTYLDHAATTPLRPRAFEAMLPFLRDHAGNPTGAHSDARRARLAVDDARDVVAERFGADPSEVIFTSGGTEADNLAVVGVASRNGGGVVCSAIEHHAVLEPVEALGGKTVDVDVDGVVDLGSLADSIDEATVLVSVMLANNETGVVQPLHKIARVVRKHAPNALLHTDAVQATAWLDVARYTQHADLVSVSAHKTGGPMGVGALIARNNVALVPQMLGGGQERERRSGSHNVAGIAGFAAAIADLRADDVERVQSLRLALEEELARVPGASVMALDAPRLPNIVNVCFEDIESEALLVLLDDAGISASAGASCSSGALQVSHVLTAMGVGAQLAQGALRLSLGWSSTENDVEMAAKIVPDVVERLRGSR